MHITLSSFGFKHGCPDADTVWDVRFLPNPYYVPELKERTGMDEQVAGYVLDNETAWEFLDLFKPLLLLFIRKHEATGREKLQLAVGCTGGKHRSVAVAEYLRRFLDSQSVVVDVVHRDMDKE